MPLEFPCPACGKTLRVPDDAAGKHAKCPNCSAINVVPGGGTPSFGEPVSPGAFGAGGDSVAPRDNPFATDAAINPYAPSQPVAYEPKPTAPMGLPITNQRPTFDDIMGHAWRVWQQNLGLLVGVTLVAYGISIGVSLPFGIAQGAAEAGGEKEIASIVSGVGNIIGSLVDLFLGIGQARIALKLTRGQQAEFGELFRGGPLYLPVLVASFLFGIMFLLGLAACIVPGILLMLAFWPYYFLMVDERAGILDSFSLALKITEGNWGTAFVVGLASFGIMILGCLALCIGVIFADPLTQIMSATAYLMMSGQLSPQAAKPPATYGV